MESFYSRPQLAGSSARLVPDESNLNISWESETASSDTEQEGQPPVQNIFERKSTVVTRLNFDYFRHDSVISAGSLVSGNVESESVTNTSSFPDIHRSLHFRGEKCGRFSPDQTTVVGTSEPNYSAVENEDGCPSSDCSNKESCPKNVEDHEETFPTNCTRCLSDKEPGDTCKMRRGERSPIIGSKGQKCKQVCDFSLENSQTSELKLHVSDYLVVLPEELHLTTGEALKNCPASPVLAPKGYGSPVVRMSGSMAAGMVSTAGASPSKAFVVKRNISEVKSPTLHSQEHHKQVSLEEFEVPLGCSKADWQNSDTVGGGGNTKVCGKRPAVGDTWSSVPAAHSKFEGNESCKKMLVSVVKKIQPGQAAHTQVVQSRSETWRRSFSKRKTSEREMFKCKTLLKLPLSNSTSGIYTEEKNPSPSTFRTSHADKTVKKLIDKIASPGKRDLSAQICLASVEKDESERLQALPQFEETELNDTCSVPTDNEKKCLFNTSSGKGDTFANNQQGEKHETAAQSLRLASKPALRLSEEQASTQPQEYPSVVNADKWFLEDEELSPARFNTDLLAENSQNTTPQDDMLNKQLDKTALQTFISCTMKKVNEKQSEISKAQSFSHVKELNSQVCSNLVIESASSQEVSSSAKKLEISQSSDCLFAKRISPVLTQEMTHNQATSSEPSTGSFVNSPCKRQPEQTSPRQPVRQEEQLLDLDSAKKLRKHWKKGSMCARLHRLLGRQKSRANLRQYELSKLTSDGAGKVEPLSSVLVVQSCWHECGRVMVSCRRCAVCSCATCHCKETDVTNMDERENDCPSKCSGTNRTVNSDMIVIIDPGVIHLPQLKPQSHIRIYPPWQVMELAQLRVTVISGVSHVDILNHGEQMQPSPQLHKSTTLQQFSCPCVQDGNSQVLVADKCYFQFAQQGAEFMHYVFPKASRNDDSQQLLPQSQMVSEQKRSSNLGTIAEAVDNYSCFLSNNIWLCVCIHKIFFYRAARCKFNCAPYTKEKISSFTSMSDLCCSLLCKDKSGEFCEVVLGPVPEYFFAAKPKTDCVQIDERDKKVTCALAFDIPRRDINLHVNSSQAENDNETLILGDCKSADVHSQFLVHKNSDLRNIYKVEYYESEMKLRTIKGSGNIKNSSGLEEICAMHSNSDICSDNASVCDGVPIVSGRNFRCLWFWQAINSEAVLYNTYKLSGLTLMKQISRNGSPSTWAIFCKTSTPACSPHTLPSEPHTSTDGILKNVEPGIRVQSVFSVFSTCSDALQVSKVQDEAASFPAQLHGSSHVSLLADVKQQMLSEDPLRCTVLVKLLVFMEGSLYVADCSFDSGKRSPSYIVVAVWPSCYVPVEVTNGSVVLLEDIIFYQDSFSADRYTRVTALSTNKLTSKFDERCNKLLQPLRNLRQALPFLQLTSVDMDLVFVCGNVVGVEEETAYVWPVCALCDNDVLAEMPSARYFCRKCMCVVSINEKMSLTVSVTCASLPVQCLVKVELLQRTILQLLSSTAQSEEGYDLTTVLGQEIGPVLCLLEKVQKVRQRVTIFLLKQIPQCADLISLNK